MEWGAGPVPIRTAARAPLAARREASWGTHHAARVWFVARPCGLVCVGVVWCLILFAAIVCPTVLLRPWLSPRAALAHTLVYLALVVLVLWSHGRSVVTNPGAVPRGAVAAPMAVLPFGAAALAQSGGAEGSAAEGAVAEESGGIVSSAPARPLKNRCDVCASFKPVRAHHCSVCDRCVVKMDHHCPWINNCVGLLNHKFFLLFLAYTTALCLYTLGLLAARALSAPTCPALTPLNPTPAPLPVPGCDATAGNQVLVTLLAVESVIFGFFTAVLQFDAWTGVFANATQIDRRKAVRRSRELASMAPAQPAATAAAAAAPSSPAAGVPDEGSCCAEDLPPAHAPAPHARVRGRSVLLDNVLEVFGSHPRFTLAWLLPVPPVFSRADRDRLLGYLPPERSHMDADDDCLESGAAVPESELYGESDASERAPVFRAAGAVSTH
jgi:hypothetical protein